MANEQVEQIGEMVRERVNGDSLSSLLKSKEIVLPALVGLAGTVAATKGPQMLRSLTGSAAAEGEQEAEKMGEKAVEGAKRGSSGPIGKLLAKGLGGGGGGQKKTRRLPIQRWTDVAVPVAKAYDAWTTFDQYPQFMHRVLNVEEEDEGKVRWQEKIWFSTREWEGEITDRRKNDRIAWKTTNGMSHRGIVSFHRLADNLTRVMVDMEFEPNGMIEKMASGLRFVKRAVESDLARFKAYVEMQDAEGIEYREDKTPTERGSSGNGRARASGSSGDRSRRQQQRRQAREARSRKS